MMDKYHILIIDDDIRILKLLKRFLEKNNYHVSAARSAIEAEEYLKYFIFDLMILDVMMPYVTGIEFAKRIKDSKMNIPIILLTALSAPEDRVLGLSSGASDHMSKPFDTSELLLRMQNLIALYGYKKHAQDVVQFGQNRYYDKSKRKIILHNQEVDLNNTEQRLLNILIENARTVLTRDDIARMMHLANERTVDVQIVKLRSKIEDDSKNPVFLQTIRNKGYILYV